jgi:hypothetical protein
MPSNKQPYVRYTGGISCFTELTELVYICRKYKSAASKSIAPHVPKDTVQSTFFLII